MNNYEFEKMKHDLKNLENRVNELTGIINYHIAAINNHNSFLTKHEYSLFSIGNYIDVMRRDILTLIYNNDNKLRKDVVSDFVSMNNNQRAERLQTSSKVENLEKNLSELKTREVWLRNDHQIIYQELEKKIAKELNKDGISSKEFDSFLVKNCGWNKDKTRLKGDKEVQVTKATYIRHFEAHGNGTGSTTNVKPTNEEISQSRFEIQQVLINYKWSY